VHLAFGEMIDLALLFVHSEQWCVSTAVHLFMNGGDFSIFLLSIYL